MYVVCRSCTDAELHHNHSKLILISTITICTGLSMCREKASAIVHSTQCPITSTKKTKLQSYLIHIKRNRLLVCIWCVNYFVLIRMQKVAFFLVGPSSQQAKDQQVASQRWFLSVCPRTQQSREWQHTAKLSNIKSQPDYSVGICWIRWL